MNRERCREIRIKRANTDWWINEKAVVGANGKTYIGYMTDMGEIHVKEIDAKCSRAASQDVTLCRLNCNYADEHNSPSLCILEDGRLVVAYTGHAATATLTCRMTARPYDIFSFGPAMVLQYDKSVTYAQLFENSARQELWLFTRVNGVTWEFRTAKIGGEATLEWGAPTQFLASDAGGLFYFDVRKQLVPGKKGTREQWFFALYGHPRISRDHTIRSGIFDAEGWLLTMDGARTGMNLFGAEGAVTSHLALEELAVVYDSPADTTVRLLEVAPTVPLRVGLASFVLDHPETITYYIASWHKDGWMLSQPIAKGGEFLTQPPMLDGSQTYVGGMACYYGVGEAGYSMHDSCSSETNRVYIARFDGSARVLESYVSHDRGGSYQLEDVLRRIPATERAIKIWRPIVPIFAQDNLPVYWHEGTYTAHTGGWHCDAVMDVEYDD